MLTGHGPNGSTMSVGVEVKTVMDLMSSIATGRLAGHQIPGMFRTYDQSWLVVHGQVRADDSNYLQIKRKAGWRHYLLHGREVPWSYLEGWLLTATMTSPLKVKWAANLNEVASWVACLDGWLAKEWEKHRALSVFHKTPHPVMPPGVNPVESLMAEVASTFPAMGWERGWAAARNFDSIGDMVQATKEEWQEIRGIGPVIAKSVHDAIRRKK
jgi:ERCC4-type nuclease